MTSTPPIHLHAPNDAPGLTAAIEDLGKQGIPVTVYDEGDSYEEWGEVPKRPDETLHIVIEVPQEHGEPAYSTLAAHQVPVDASSSDDHAEDATAGWSVPRAPGWFSRHPQSAVLTSHPGSLATDTQTRLIDLTHQISVAVSILTERERASDEGLPMLLSERACVAAGLHVRHTAAVRDLIDGIITGE